MSAHTLRFRLDPVIRFDHVEELAATLVARYAGWPIAKAREHVEQHAVVVLRPRPDSEPSRLDLRAHTRWIAEVEVTV